MSVYQGPSSRSTRYLGNKVADTMYLGASSLFPAWTPANLTTAPVGWWDAADAATLTLVGSAVSAWANKGSAGGSASQSTSESRPAYSATALNSLPGLTFNGSFMTSSVGTSSDCSIFVIFKNETDYINNMALFGQNGQYYGLAIANYATNLQFYADSGGIIGSATISAAALAAAVKSSTSGTLYLNDTADSTGTVGSGAFSNMSIGAWAGEQYHGVIQEIIYLPYAADTTTRQKIAGYLMWKWGMQASLPIGHPYKSAPPTV